jgi:hypothetical protein
VTHLRLWAQVAQFSEGLLLDFPLPDFSMPFNVLCLSATVIAMTFSAAFRIIAPVPLVSEADRLKQKKERERKSNTSSGASENEEKKKNRSKFVKLVRVVRWRTRVHVVVCALMCVRACVRGWVHLRVSVSMSVCVCCIVSESQLVACSCSTGTFCRHHMLACV